MSEPVEVLLYGRPGCHLCDEVHAEIVAMATDNGWRIALREVDIESDDDLFRRCLERIPVIEVGGEVVSELLLDREALTRRIATLAGDG